MQTWLNLQDKIIIVTGGASGIGLAIVEELLAQGANVQMVDIHGGDGQYESHKGYQFWPTDISSAKEINHTVAEIIQRFGRIDCIDSLEVRKKPGGHWIIRYLAGLDLVGLASL